MCLAITPWIIINWSCRHGWLEFKMTNVFTGPSSTPFVVCLAHLVDSALKRWRASWSIHGCKGFQQSLNWIRTGWWLWSKNVQYSILLDLTTNIQYIWIDPIFVWRPNLSNAQTGNCLQAFSPFFQTLQGKSSCGRLATNDPKWHVQRRQWCSLKSKSFFPTCQVRVVRFYQSCSPPPPPHPPPPSPPLPPPRSPDPNRDFQILLVAVQIPTATSRSQWALPDLNGKFQIAVGTAGPQRRIPDRSGHCRTSTATSRSQWALPDLNRDFQIAVGTAGPQPRLPDRSGHCRTSTGRMWEDMSDRMS